MNVGVIAKNGGYYKEDIFGKQYDKVKILTVEELMKGTNVKALASTKTTLKQPKKWINLYFYFFFYFFRFFFLNLFIILSVRR